MHLKLITAAIALATCSLFADDWPQFRGVQGKSIGVGKVPVVFGPETNLVWKVEVPKGHSSPVIWGEKIFLTGFEEGRLKTFCLQKGTGQKLWERSAPGEKLEPAHPLNGPAAPTPVANGKELFVYFGSFGLLAYDLDGKELWQRAFPAPLVEFGSGSSPILADGKLILLCDQDLDSFLLALDPKTGKDIWKTERAQFRRGFATPFLWRNKVRDELIIPGSIYLKSYSPQDGSELWTYEGTARVANASATGDEDILVSSSWNIGGDPGDRVTMPDFQEFAERNDRNKDGLIAREEIADKTLRDRYTQMDLDKNKQVTEKEWTLMKEMFDKASNGLIAIRPGGKSVINNSHVAWRVTRSLPYVSSPLLYHGRVFTVKSGGLASCYEAANGKVFYQDERLGALGDYYSSAIGVDGKVYFASQNGIVTVIKAGDQLEVLARNDLDEQIFATPAASGSSLFYRTANALYCFGVTSK